MSKEAPNLHIFGSLHTKGGGVSGGILGSQQIKTAGNVINCPENQYEGGREGGEGGRAGGREGGRGVRGGEGRGGEGRGGEG